MDECTSVAVSMNYDATIIGYDDGDPTSTDDACSSAEIVTNFN